MGPDICALISETEGSLGHSDYLSPNGRWLLTMEGLTQGFGIWDLAASPPCRIDAVGGVNTSVHPFSPDSRWLVVLDWGNSPYWDIWETEPLPGMADFSMSPAGRCSPPIVKR